MNMERKKQQKPSASGFFIHPPPPPRTLNVKEFAESRAPELQSLHSVVSNRLSCNFKSQHNQRRRTTSFNKRSRKRQNSNNNTDHSGKPLPSRRVRRRIELRKNPESGFSASGDGTKRLPTHIWHAKRFEMVKKWGFYLPLGLPGRGKGSRALLKWFRRGALVHDSSYNTAIQLEGPQDSLLLILRMVLVPTPSDPPDEPSTSTLSGSTCGSGMLHHVGAPFSQRISPVIYMWRPYNKETINSDAENDCIISGSVSPSSSFCSSSVRQMWVWIHAGAISEGFGALRLACQKQRDETGISVKCFSLEGQLAKLEVMGSNAIQILQKILHPISGTIGSSSELMTSSIDGARMHPQLKRSFILEHAVHLPDHAILSLVVKDPRDLPKEGPKLCPEAASYMLDADVVKGDYSGHSASTACSDQYKEIISSSWLKSDNVLYSDSKDLWENHNNMNPPVEENLLCMEKHHKRMDFFHINKNIGITSTEITKQSSRSCPVILLKESNLRRAGVRWTIILPLSWVKAFWLPLVNQGAHAVGLRERHWIAGDVGLPSFPFDFPDCKAYSLFMTDEAIASDEKMQLRPPAVRPFKVPIPPPWDSVRFAFENISRSVDDVQVVCKEGSGGREYCDLLDDDAGDNCETKMLEQEGCVFDGFIARTSSVLSSHLNEIHGEKLLLFPNGQGSKKSKLKKKKVELVWGSEGNAHLPFDRKLCFLRVLLRAYKEGAFEEGSVVCAPHLTDILLWTSRSDVEEGRLKIPDSFIGSYFKMQSSGKWEIHKPEDPVNKESHRWPIGFVTTGFVRGSTTPLAGAFCEATLLAQLRREQWNGKTGNQSRGEIFVLVRNLRSAAYRLALATIVLEREREDLDYM